MKSPNLIKIIWEQLWSSHFPHNPFPILPHLFGDVKINTEHSYLWYCGFIAGLCRRTLILISFFLFFSNNTPTINFTLLPLLMISWNHIHWLQDIVQAIFHRLKLIFLHKYQNTSMCTMGGILFLKHRHLTSQPRAGCISDFRHVDFSNTLSDESRCLLSSNRNTTCMSYTIVSRAWLGNPIPNLHSHL